jgi:hypothetical protein
MRPASPKKQLTSKEPLKRLYVDQPLNANAESFPLEIKACGTLKGTQRWRSSASVSRARLLLFRLRLSAAVAVTGPSATVATVVAVVTALPVTVAAAVTDRSATVAGAVAMVVAVVTALPATVAAAVTDPSATVAGAVATVVAVVTALPVTVAAAVTDPSATVAGAVAMVVAAVTGPSATVAAMGAMGTAAAVRTTDTDTEVMFCRTCLDITDRVTRTQPTARGITGNFTHPRNSLRNSSNHPMRRHLLAFLKQTTRHG